MQTKATRRHGGWQINGSKAWITNAVSADLFLVYAQTDVGAGPAGIAAFLVERTCAGLSITAPYDLVGCHSMGLAGVELSDCFVPDEALFARPGEGFKRAMSGIDVARTLVSAMCCGMLQSSLTHALKATAERSAFGSRTIEFQGLQWMLADVATDLSASELLFAAAASKLDRGERARLRPLTRRNLLQGQRSTVSRNVCNLLVRAVFWLTRQSRGIWPPQKQLSTSTARRRYRMLLSPASLRCGRSRGAHS